MDTIQSQGHPEGQGSVFRNMHPAVRSSQDSWGGGLASKRGRVKPLSEGLEQHRCDPALGRE